MHWCLLFISIGRYIVIDVVKPISGTIFFHFIFENEYEFIYKSHKLTLKLSSISSSCPSKKW